MHIVVRRNPRKIPKASKRVVVTIGNFDGVHVGHKKVIEKLVSTARTVGGEAAVISFYPHPSVVLGRAQTIPLLTPLHQKARLLEQLGVSTLLLLRFTKELAALSAAEFLDRYMIELLGASHLVLGPDTALGRNREGDQAFLRTYLGSRGIEVESVPFFESKDGRVSSRRIRESIAAGDVTAAADMLGRPYVIEGHVRAGDRRGRTIGFPTANILPGSQMLPRLGVYATRVTVGNAVYDAVTNVGVRPTFGAGAVAIESHLLAFDGDLYGKRIEVAFVARIRDELRFSGVDALKEQISRDVTEARRLLGRL